MIVSATKKIAWWPLTFLVRASALYPAKLRPSISVTSAKNPSGDGLFIARTISLHISGFVKSVLNREVDSLTLPSSVRLLRRAATSAVRG